MTNDDIIRKLAGINTFLEADPLTPPDVLELWRQRTLSTIREMADYFETPWEDRP